MLLMALVLATGGTLEAKADENFSYCVDLSTGVAVYSVGSFCSHDEHAGNFVEGG